MTADKMRWLVASIVLLVVLPVLLIANLAASSVRGSTISSPLASSTDCFPAFGKGTGKWFTDQHRLLQRNFLDYWSTPNPNHAAWLGTPVSDELFERTEATGAGGQPFRMQYFSNAVMEYHPELPTPAVQLSLLGQFRYKEKYAGATPIETPPTTTATPFPATGKHITGIFNTYWKNNGDVERFGLPITEKIKERVPGDPTPRTTQYFERAELYIDSSQKVRQVPLGELRYQSKYPGTDFQMLVPTPKA